MSYIGQTVREKATGRLGLVVSQSGSQSLKVLFEVPFKELQVEGLPPQEVLEFREKIKPLAERFGIHLV